MAIIFDCICGFEVKALDGQAGRKVLCPVCRSDLTVPPRSTPWRPAPVPDLGIAIRAEPIQRRRRRGPTVLGRLPVFVFVAVGLAAMWVLGWGLVHRPFAAPDGGPPAVVLPTNAVETPAVVVDRAAVELAARDEARQAEEATLPPAAKPKDWWRPPPGLDPAGRQRHAEWVAAEYRRSLQPLAELRARNNPSK